MHPMRRNLVRVCGLAVCSAIVASGCLIDRGPLTGPGPYRVEPAQYCAGDTVRAQFDFLGSDVCPAGVDCAPFFPVVRITGTPADFPPQSIGGGYVGGVGFVPSGDSINVRFDADDDPVLLPTAEIRDGVRVFRAMPSDANRIANRIPRAIETDLMLPGDCAGASPVNIPATLEGPPRLSPNLKLSAVCNLNSFQVTITLRGASGDGEPRMLAAGECYDTSMPGVPASARDALLIEARHSVPPVGVMCSATGPNSPPPTIRLRARRACG